MGRFLLIRLGQTIIILFLMSIIVFSLARLTGDPVSLLITESATKEDIKYITKELGLDKSLPTQYGIFLFNTIKGDLGRSVRGAQTPVTDLILDRAPASLQLATLSLLVSLLIGLPLGVLSAVKRGSFWDVGARILAMLGQSAPVFWLGLMGMYLFAVELRWLPASGYGRIDNFVLPVLSLSCFAISAITRLGRNSMLEVLDNEYIKLAKVKGISEIKVVFKHALRNSLIPVITFSGTVLARLITGAVVVETIFEWPGIGRLAYESVIARDFPVVQGVVLFMTTIFVLVNLVVDNLYAYIDPRIRYD